MRLAFVVLYIATESGGIVEMIPFLFDGVAAIIVGILLLVAVRRQWRSLFMPVLVYEVILSYS